MKPVQSVERSFAIIEVVAAEPCGLSEAARRVELPKSTVARLMATLEAVGAVERIGERYHLGPTITRSATSQSGLVALAAPYLEGLAAELNEAAGLSIAEGERMHTIVQVDVDRTVQARDWTGERAMIHSVPSGLVMMAEWPADRLDRLLSQPLDRSTSKTLVDAAQIRKRLVAVGEQGFAWGKEEFHDGINSVAAPVRDGSATIIAALHVHGPAYRFPSTGSEDAIARAVAGAATALGRSYASSPVAAS